VNPPGPHLAFSPLLDLKSMGMEFDSFAQLVASANRLRIVNCVNVVSLTILVYDYCLVLSSEVDLVWKSKWSIVKVLYLLTRYPAFSDTALSVYESLGPVALENCWAINAAGTWSTLFGISVAEVILVLRTAALWGNNKKILWSLSLVLAALVIICMVFQSLFLNSQTAKPPPFPSISGCNLVGGNPIVIFNFIFLIMFEIAILVLTTYRWFKRFKGSANPLVATLYRDGIVFFVCLSLISLGNVLILSLGPDEYHALITPFQRVMHSVLSCRILLNLREANRKSKANRLAELQLSTMSKSDRNHLVSS